MFQQIYDKTTSTTPSAHIHIQTHAYTVLDVGHITHLSIKALMVAMPTVPLRRCYGLLSFGTECRCIDDADLEWGSIKQTYIFHLKKCRVDRSIGRARKIYCSQHGYKRTYGNWLEEGPHHAWNVHSCCQRRARFAFLISWNRRWEGGGIWKIGRRRRTPTAEWDARILSENYSLSSNKQTNSFVRIPRPVAPALAAPHKNPSNRKIVLLAISHSILMHDPIHGTSTSCASAKQPISILCTKRFVPALGIPICVGLRTSRRDNDGPLFPNLVLALYFWMELHKQIQDIPESRLHCSPFLVARTSHNVHVNTTNYMCIRNGPISLPSHFLSRCVFLSRSRSYFRSLSRAPTRSTTKGKNKSAIS